MLRVILPGVIDLSTLGLEHDGEPIVEIDLHDGFVISLHLGIACFRNRWALEDLAPDVQAAIDRLCLPWPNQLSRWPRLDSCDTSARGC
jgi:hypothetical protein